MTQRTSMGKPARERMFFMVSATMRDRLLELARTEHKTVDRLVSEIFSDFFALVDAHGGDCGLAVAAMMRLAAEGGASTADLTRGVTIKADILRRTGAAIYVVPPGAERDVKKAAVIPKGRFMYATDPLDGDSLCAIRMPLSTAREFNLEHLITRAGGAIGSEK